VEQGDARGAVRIVLDRRDLAGTPILFALPVDDAVALLVAAAAEARRDAAGVVAAARRGLVLGELLLGLLAG
jgi:hypothetical protein